MKSSGISLKCINLLLPKFALGLAVMLGSIVPAWAATSAVLLAGAAPFTVLGNTDVTCTKGVIVNGDVGVASGSYTNTNCVIAGLTPPETNAAASLAQGDLSRAYSEVQSLPCTQTISTAAYSGNKPALGPLAPGVYCFPAGLTFTNTTLTLSGSPAGTWFFKVGAGLTGTGFTIVMADGGLPDNVYWAVGAGVTLTNSNFKGNILAGSVSDGSITTTNGTVVGRALAKVAVTITRTKIQQ